MTDSTSDSPEQIGPYKLREQLGEGGMGEVWLAEQTEPVHRRVALKVIKLGMDTKQVLARLEAERQALAVMDHPNIARFFDGGATETGRPYFVMELVQGTNLTDYCDTNRLSTDDRIRLFIDVCQAVQHAHHKGVVHRDLKPSNVLVTVKDKKPVAKIIDFGIAKALGQELTDQTLFTRMDQIIGTPEYMSPEQAEMSGLDVDTRTDVYSLGVMLYELLVGARPFDLGARVDQAIRYAIRETEVPKPSTRLTGLGETQDTIARHRRTTVDALKKELKTDLDWIILKAMEKDRTRRYETANAFAQELERHLRHEPVEARAPSATYRMGKFIRRHRLGVTSAGAIAILVVAATVLLSVQAGRLERERDRSNAEAATAKAVLDFMDDMLESPVDFYDGLGGDVSFLQVLDSTALKLEDYFVGAPEAKASAMDAMGRAYLALGRFEKAEPLFRSTLEIRRDLFGNSRLEVAQSINNYASVIHETEDYEAAEPLYREAIALFLELDADDSGTAGKAMANLALLLDMKMEKPDEAEDMYEKAIKIGERTLDESDPDLALWRHNYAGFLCVVRGNSERGAALERAAIPVFEKAQQSMMAAVGRSMLGYCLTDLAHYDEAETQLLQAVRELEAGLRPDHPRLESARDRLGRLYEMWGRPDQAAVYREKI
ncbi:protein kinase [Gemmatimonadota bacterium]